MQVEGRYYPVLRPTFTSRVYTREIYFCNIITIVPGISTKGGIHQGRRSLRGVTLGEHVEWGVHPRRILEQQKFASKSGLNVFLARF